MLKPPIVLDNGSKIMKIGFAGEEAPRATIPAVVGRPRRATSTDSSEYLGAAAVQNRKELVLKYPVECQVICNWEDVEKVAYACSNHDRTNSFLSDSKALQNSQNAPKFTITKFKAVATLNFVIVSLPSHPSRFSRYSSCVSSPQIINPHCCCPAMAARNRRRAWLHQCRQGTTDPAH
jgi:hypothetical protein